MTYLPSGEDCDALITAVRLVQARRSAAEPVEFNLAWAAVLALADLVIVSMSHTALVLGEEGREAQEAWTDARLADLLDNYTLLALEGALNAGGQV